MATGGELVYDALLDSGIGLLVGLPGTQTLPLDRVVTRRDGMRYVMARHETAVPHIAWGYYEAGGSPAATLTVPGPGETNAMHGLKNALEDCVPVVHIGPDPTPEERGKSPIHEIDHDTFDNVVKANIRVDRPERVREAVARGVGVATEPPLGPVRLGIPSGFLATEVTSPAAAARPERVAHDNTDAYDRAAALLDCAERPAVYVGGGTRRGDREGVLALVEALDAPVVASYRGKGVVPDDDPRMMGTTGSFLPAGARNILEDADTVVALGTDFDGPTTDSWSLPMGEDLIHVTLDSGSVGAAYEPSVAILDDACEAAAELAGRTDPDGWDGAAIGGAVSEEYETAVADRGAFDDVSPARTPAVLRELRDVVPDEAPVVTDIGGHRLWAFELFDAYAPENYITAGSWAGMGVGLPGAVGAALARDDPVVCLHGDGGLLMCSQELHTAVEENLDLTCVVFDNADYGVISKGSPADFSWDAPDFESMAAAFDCRATRVDTARDAADAVATAVGRSGPDLVSVAVDPEEPTAKSAARYESTVRSDRQ
jgi:acetolactate synthase-1/2/3 large subunit